MADGERATKRFLCVVDVLPWGRIAALEIWAEDAIAAERRAHAAGRERYGAVVEVLEVLPAELATSAA